MRIDDSNTHFLLNIITLTAFDMYRILLIPLCFSIIVIVNIAGNQSPPFSILMTPFVIIITTLISISINSINLFFRTVLCVFLVIFNDFLLKKYAGGVHDLEGQGWIQLMTVLGLIPAIIIYIRFILKNRFNRNLTITSVSIGAFFLISYFIYFNFFGMIRKNQTSISIKESKQSKRFLCDLIIPSDIAYKAAWAEYEEKDNHLGLIKKKERTGEIVNIIELDTTKFQYVNKYFSIGGSMNSQFIGNRIEFKSSNNLKEFKIYIKELNKHRIILDTVTVKRPL